MNRVAARQLVATFVPSVLVLAVILVMRARFGVATSMMTEDVTWTAGVHPLTGFLSSFGVLLWSATASICFFAATALPKTEPRRTFWFLLSSGLLSTYLLFDDLFMVHEDLAARYFGLPQAAVFAILGVAVAAYLIAFRRTIGRTDFRLLVLAMGFFAASILIDEFVIEMVRSGRGFFFLEDGTKWLGIACWCSYYVRTAYQLVVGTLERPTSEAQPGS